MREKRAPSKVLVVSPTPKVTELLCEILPKSCFDPLVTVSSCGEAKRTLLSSDFDIIVINAPLHDEFGSEFAMDIVEKGPSVALLLVSNDIYEQVSYTVEGVGVMSIAKPLSRATLYSAVKLAVATHARLCAMDRKNKSLSTKMSEVRIVNRAKWALIENLNMTEEQAHKYIEKQAMDLRMSKREVSEGIIKTYTL